MLHEKNYCWFVQILLELGASPNYKDGHGLTPLYYAVSRDADPKCIEMLLYDHAVIGTADDHGWAEVHQVELLVLNKTLMPWDTAWILIVYGIETCYILKNSLMSWYIIVYDHRLGVLTWVSLHAGIVWFAGKRHKYLNVLFAGVALIS